MSDRVERCVVIANCEDELAIRSAIDPLPSGWRRLAECASTAEGAALVAAIEGETRTAVLRSWLERERIRP